MSIHALAAFALMLTACVPSPPPYQPAPDGGVVAGDAGFASASDAGFGPSDMGFEPQDGGFAADAMASNDAGATDAAAAGDAGFEPDAAAAGDAGFEPDATTPTDTGFAPDATPAADASAISDGGYATTFPAAENPVSEGNRWITGQTVGLDWNNPRTTPGLAFASTLSGLGSSRYDDSIAALNLSFSPDQYAEGVVYRASGYLPGASKHEVELLLRFQITAHLARGYEILWGHSGYLAVVRWNGPLGDYSAFYDPGDPGIGPPADGDILRAEIIGNIITVYKNSALVATVDVGAFGGSIWATGQPGMGFWPVDSSVPENMGWASYRAGNL